MIEIETETGGQLKPDFLEYFGGKYTLWERLKMGGNGSAKTLYLSGIEPFDQHHRGVSGETAYVSFEIFKNGLILRLNNNQRFSCVGFLLHELKAIQLTGYRVATRKRRGSKIHSYFGALSITTQTHIAKFALSVSEYEAVNRFFQKPELKEKFFYTISTDPNDEDYQRLIELFDIELF